MATDKSAIQVGDPSAITNILNDHGINQKINGKILQLSRYISSKLYVNCFLQFH